ncbi:PREDICTED: uncharacterized protein LOC106806688 [Priapulus caudatus]|uniref:Uncharacterized protein LOC106806688 n=1 Tax=Priapulus caudatus TaxID=37621 RepID=A0ABM1DW63_PRICU|nr:PREDICTED: uncharacterized protein LOC106806688 [Priapulus caudatus]
MTEYVTVENNKRLRVSNDEASAEATVLEKNGHAELIPDQVQSVESSVIETCKSDAAVTGNGNACSTTHKEEVSPKEHKDLTPVSFTEHNESSPPPLTKHKDSALPSSTEHKDPPTQSLTESTLPLPAQVVSSTLGTEEDNADIADEPTKETNVNDDENKDAEVNSGANKETEATAEGILDAGVNTEASKEPEVAVKGAKVGGNAGKVADECSEEDSHDSRLATSTADESHDGVEHSEDSNSRLAEGEDAEEEEIEEEDEAPSPNFHFREVKGDIFSASDTKSLAHCISRDRVLVKGISKHFKKKFGGAKDLKDQNKEVGAVAVLKRGQRFIYYLVTKDKHFQKPTYAALRQSLRATREHCRQHRVKHLCMSRLGCGLDGLDWTRMSAMIVSIFKPLAITVSVYYL